MHLRIFAIKPKKRYTTDPDHRKISIFFQQQAPPKPQSALRYAQPSVRRLRPVIGDVPSTPDWPPPPRWRRARREPRSRQAGVGRRAAVLGDPRPPEPLDPRAQAAAPVGPGPERELANKYNQDGAIVSRTGRPAPGSSAKTTACWEHRADAQDQRGGDGAAYHRAGPARRSIPTPKKCARPWSTARAYARA